jgi:hypothetical protein
MDQLLHQFNTICDSLRSQGYNVVAAVSKYDEKSTKFHTLIRAQDADRLAKRDMTLDHVVLDALRNISIEWSNNTHDDKIRLK